MRPAPPDACGVRQVLGHSIDEVWCGHQVYSTDSATEAAMLNGVRGATAFLLVLTRRCVPPRTAQPGNPVPILGCTP